MASMPELTRTELENGRRVIDGRWPAWYRRQLTTTPRNEQLIMSMLATLLDAEPVDEDTLEPLADIEARTLARRPTTPAPGLRAGPPAEWLELGERLGATKAAA